MVRIVADWLLFHFFLMPLESCPGLCFLGSAQPHSWEMGLTVISVLKQYFYKPDSTYIPFVLSVPFHSMAPFSGSIRSTRPFFFLSWYCFFQLNENTLCDWLVGRRMLVCFIASGLCLWEAGSHSLVVDTRMSIFPLVFSGYQGRTCED